MAKILWRRICETYGQVVLVPFWCCLMLVVFGYDDKPIWKIIMLGMIFIALIAAIILAGISSEPPVGVFIAPFSKEDRRKLVIRTFYKKIAVGTAVMTIALTLALLLGAITLLNWLTMFIISLSLSYMSSFRRFYTSYYPSLEVLAAVLMIVDVVVFIGAGDNDFLSFGKNSGGVLLIIAAILAAVHYFAYRRYFKPMVECYSDYEKMTDINKKIKTSQSEWR